MRRSALKLTGALALAVLVAACGSDDDSEDLSTTDPGRGEWELVSPEDVLDECGLDRGLLLEADAALDLPWAVVRYGKLCHEFYPSGEDEVTHAWSATKTLGATVTGIAAYQTRDLTRSGRKTGPLRDDDRVDHWLDEFSFNPDAQIAHVLGMVAFNEDLSLGNKMHSYDASGDREINRLSDIINTVIAQDPDRFGADLEEFTQRYLFEKLGMTGSVWSEGQPDKRFGFGWFTPLRDMARLGLLILNGGVWNGERLLSEEWIYRMTHPSFEDANTSYGYLTWLAANTSYSFGGILGGVSFTIPLDPCSPAAINATFPHGISDSPDCNYTPPWSCEQEYDVGVWWAAGAGGQLIVGHPGLDMVLLVKDIGEIGHHGTLWGPVRPALVAADPVFQGDEEAFCEAYGAGSYAPDLR